MAACIMQRTQQQTTDRVQHAPSNVQHATAFAQRIATNKQRAECNSQQIAGDVQQTADAKRTRAACLHMRVATANTRHCHISCAASSGQRANSSMREALYSTTSAQHGTDATHKMQHTTRAAACNKLTCKDTGRGERNPQARAPRGSVSYPIALVKYIPTPRKSDVQTRTPSGMQGRERDRSYRNVRKSPKRRSASRLRLVSDSALRSRRAQLDKGALIPCTKRAAPKVLRTGSQRARQSPELRFLTPEDSPSTRDC